MTYADITFKDKNPIKRWLQSRRLFAALRMADQMPYSQRVLDFGAGNGELCKIIASRSPRVKIVCYEPIPSLMAEAKENLHDFPEVSFCSELREIADSSIELIFCLEVFEHLPEAETKNALEQINRLLSSNGSAVIGVPVEIGFPAFYKGIFRMSRRFNAFDASIKNVVLASLSFPPKDRPVSIIAPGFAFHYQHMGFDYRKLQTRLNSRFKLLQTSMSPMSIFGPWLNPEINFLVQKQSMVVNAEATQ